MENLSYFQMKLRTFVESAHPDLIESFKDSQEYDTFIEQRANEALSQFESLTKEGVHQDSALESALATLKEGLLFSKFDCIDNIVHEYYPEIIDKLNKESEYKDFIISLIQHCEDIFINYNTSDDFAYTNFLETEIIGKIATLID
jgi:hypothetical protein